MMFQASDKEIVEAVGGNLAQWAKNCHAVSMQFCRSKIAPEGARVARGYHKMIASQHSWVAFGDPYGLRTQILDLSIWSYVCPESPVIVTGFNYDCLMHCGGEYLPKGYGDIWGYGQPVVGDGERIRPKGLSDEAEHFLEIFFPDGLDVQGWHGLLNSPVGGWPAKDVFECAWKDDRLKALCPIDVVGMVTDLNPGGMYLPEKAFEEC